MTDSFRLVVLDRDGVINEDSDAFIKSPDEWVAIPGSLEAIARLCDAGYTVTVATNQSGIARGYFDEQVLDAIHDKMLTGARMAGGEIDFVAVCPHGPDDDCDCRKPRPGLLKQIADRYRASLDDVPVVGDSLRDLQAGASVGAKPMLVLTGKGEKTAQALPDDLKSTPVYADLASATDVLIGAGS
ncbi:MAG: D-glycero-beta-D-manno-heptose 1,7-bisphosphate 7-phosphatase [Woeseiaceae bacterium]|nr:D-glycero-beta-D-manno-heptose 1,7-bisphosphate 7-phosphatase [Woeseiaceae bacterium]